jgi:hypothetical protein
MILSETLACIFDNIHTTDESNFFSCFSLLGWLWESANETDR